MALAPRPLATTVFVCRMMAVVLQAAALSCVVLAGDLWFSTFIFLKALLAVELALNAARLIYDAAQVFFQKPLPAFRWQMMGLVAADWVPYSSILFHARRFAQPYLSTYECVHAWIAGDDAPPFRCWVELPRRGGLCREQHEALRVAAARDVRAVQGLRRTYLAGVGFHCSGRLRYAPSAKDLG
ncbi:hypothetical protein ACQJBY_059284 [Aegilops geniculata]